MLTIAASALLPDVGVERLPRTGIASSHPGGPIPRPRSPFPAASTKLFGGSPDRNAHARGPSSRRLASGAPPLLDPGRRASGRRAGGALGGELRPCPTARSGRSAPGSRLGVGRRAHPRARSARLRGAGSARGGGRALLAGRLPPGLGAEAWAAVALALRVDCHPGAPELESPAVAPGVLRSSPCARSARRCGGAPRAPACSSLHRRRPPRRRHHPRCARARHPRRRPGARSARILLARARLSPRPAMLSVSERGHRASPRA